MTLIFDVFTLKEEEVTFRKVKKESWVNVHI